MTTFDSVADEYDAARPSYPPEVFDALGPLAGLRVLDIGAGTGIATRELLRRGARVVAVDAGAEVLRRAVAHSPELPAVVSDGAALPVPDGCIDLACFAQAWHWLDPTTRVAEMHRILRPGGRWAGWWSHARADDEQWFDRYWATIERWCPGTHRTQRDTDWGATLARGRLFDVEARRDLAWTRTITIDARIADQASHSYVIVLDDETRTRLLDELRAIVDAAFPAGMMSVRYETWLWMATRV
jgi:SAM-dependent methyltransferase